MGKAKIIKANGMIIIGACDIHKEIFSMMSVPYMSEVVKNLNPNSQMQTVKVMKRQSCGHTASIAKAVQCNFTNFMTDSLINGFWKRDLMLSLIEKKRTPDYVNKSIGELL